MLRLHAPNELTQQRYLLAASRRSLLVELLTSDPAQFPMETGPDVVIRAPTALITEAIRRGCRLELNGPNPAWFVGLGAEVSGRSGSSPMSRVPP